MQPTLIELCPKCDAPKTSAGCPDRDCLEAFSLGKLPADELAALAARIEGCVSCEATLGECERNLDTLVEALGRPVADAEFWSDAAFQEKMQQAESILPQSPPAQDPLPAQAPPIQRLREYELLSRLGEGGMGAVYLARHTHLEKLVAVKILPSRFTADAAAVARFRREMKAVGKLSHPNIVQATDAGEVDGTHFLVMEYVPGHDLNRLIKEQGPLSPAEAVRCVLQAARGLWFAHQHGVIHRDVKPANLLRDPAGAVRVADLGLARLHDAATVDSSEAAGLTSTGAVMGTIDYMAPEQALNPRHADHRADIYGLGCSLFYLLTGRTPYQGETVMGKLLAHREAPLPRLTDICGETAAPLQELFERMVAKRPENRFPSMGGAITSLENCVMRLAALPTNVSAAPTPPLSQPVDAPDSDTQDWTPSVSATPLSSPYVVTPAPEPLANGSRIRRSRWVAVALLAASGLIYLVATVIVNLVTRDGSIVVHIEAPGEVVVEVFDDKGVLEISKDGDDERFEISIDPGQHRLEVKQPGGKPFFTNEFSIETDGHKEFTARYVPLEVEKPTGDEDDLPRTATGSDREVAEWVLSIGGKVQITEDWAHVRPLHPIGDLNELPEQVQLYAINLFANPQVADSDMERFLPLRKLEFLDLCGTNVSDQGLVDVGRLVSLERLDLSDMPRISDAGLAHLGRLAILSTLELRGSPITGVGLPNLLQLPRLSALDLHATQVGDAGIANLQGLGVRSLVLGSDGITDEGLETLGTCGLTKLEVLQIFGNFTNDGLESLKSIPTISNLRLTSPNLTDEGLSHLRELGALIHLQLNDQNVTDRGLDCLAGSGLESLSLERTNITDAGLETLGALPKLVALNLHGTGVTDAGLELLQQNPKLAYINLTETKVTEAGVSALRVALPRCEIVWPSSPNSPSSATQRRAAEWVLAAGGKLKIVVNGEASAAALKTIALGDGIQVQVSGEVSDVGTLASVPADDFQIISIKLNGNLPIGGLARLAGLTGLLELEITTNRLEDADLVHLQRLDSLCVLALHTNLLTDAGLAHLTGLIAMRQLGLRQMEGITDEGLAHFAGLRNLEVLSVGPKVTGTGLAHLENTKLLKLEGGHITDEGLAVAAKVRSLVVLYLAGSPVTGQGLARLKELPLLAQLGLEGCPLTDDDLEGLRGLKTVQGLWLYSPNLTDSGLGRLSQLGLEGLLSLSIDGTRITDAGMSKLKNLQTLQILNLTNTSVTTGAFVNPEGLISLTSLSMAGTPVADEQLAPLANLRALQSLDLSNTLVTAAGAKKFRESLPGCTIQLGVTDPERYICLRALSGGGTVALVAQDKRRSIRSPADIPLPGFQIVGLDLSQRADVTDQELAYIGKLAKLDSLNLEGTPVSDEGLSHLAGGGSLKFLDLTFCRVTDAGLAHLASHTELERLDLAATQITDSGLAHLVGLSKLRLLALNSADLKGPGLAHLVNLPALRILMFQSPQITADGLESIGKMQNLEHLVLSGTGASVTDEGLKQLHSLKRLKQLGLRGSSASAAGIAELQTALPNCKIER